MKIYDFQKSFKFYKINIKFCKLYPTFSNDGRIRQTIFNVHKWKFKIYKSHSKYAKEIPSSTNDIQLLQMMGKYYKPQPTFANENTKFGIAIQNSQNNTKCNKWYPTFANNERVPQTTTNLCKWKFKIWNSHSKSAK